MEIKTDDAKMSYALGINMGAQVSQLPLDVDVDALLKGVRDMIEGNETKLPREECIKYLDELFQKLHKEHSCNGSCHDCEGGCSHDNEAEIARNQKAGDEYRAENAKKAGVTTTPSGLQIEIHEQGDSRRATESSVVKVHYTGKLIDGKVFDSSVQRGEPIEFSLNRVIPGWTEGMQLIGVGGKATLVIPPELGYGESGAGGVIPPQATLVFDVELLDIK